MRNQPTIYVVFEVNGDRYDIFDITPVAWFFDECEAEDWAEVRRPMKNLRVEVVPGGKW